MAKKQKPLYERFTELPNRAVEDNKNQKGLYIIGLRSKKLVYGFSERKSREEAQAELTSKGYSGEVLCHQAFNFPKNYIPSIWKTEPDLTEIVD